MAAQITHIALAEKIFDKYFIKFNKRDFYIGTTFPDIRYLGHIQRELSHFKNVSFQDVIKQDNSFKAGVLYHSFIDEFREQWMTDHGIYDLIPRTHRATQAVKFFEDRFFYSDIADWNIIIGFYDEVLEEELDFNMESKVISVWHKALAEYFQSAPSVESMTRIIEAIHIPETERDEIIDLINVIESNQKLVNVIKDFQSSFNLLIDSKL